MEITYDTIIKYLCSESRSNFSTKKNFMSKNFPKELKEKLDPTFFRYGIQCYDDEQNNISFLSSVIHLLDKNYITMDKSEQISLIKNIKIQLKEYLAKDYSKYPLKKKFTKYSSNECLKDNKVTPLFVDLVSTF